MLRPALALPQLALILGLLSAAAPGSAQVVERHTAPGQNQAPSPEIAVPALPEVVDDNTAFGVVLRRVQLVTSSTVEQTIAPEVSLSKIEERLARFVDLPLSQRLLGEIQVEVVQLYREAGRPLVSISFPPQELTEGVLLVEVIEFHIGQKLVEGDVRGDEHFIKGRVRAGEGRAIDAPDLIQDLEWLNRDPFRNVQASFSPGKQPGETDLVLQASRTKPWKAFAGYLNAGPRDQGSSRLFTSIQVGDVLGTGSLVSYSLTADPDAWVHPRRLLGNSGEAASYVIHSGLAVLPLAPRHDVTLSGNWIRNDEPVEAFIVRQNTIEGTFIYRFGVASDAIRGDFSLGAEFRRQERNLLFGGTSVFRAGLDVVQFYSAWSTSHAVGNQQLGLTVFGRFSPGGLTSRNTNQAFFSFTEGRVTSARYVYGGLHYWVNANLGPLHVISSNLRAQVTGTPLAWTERMVIGGETAVRGYGYEDGSYDQAVVSRNEIQARNPLPLQGGALRLVPFAFLDAGFGRDLYFGVTQRLLSMGGGVNVQLGRYVSGSLSAGIPLVDGPNTRARSSRLHARFVVGF